MRDAGLDQDRVLVLALELRQQLVGCFLVRVVVQGDLAAVVGEFAGDGAAKAAGAAGDDGDFIRETGH